MTEFYRLHHNLEYPEKWYLHDILGPNRKEITPTTFTLGVPLDPIPEITIIPNVDGKSVDFTLQTFEVPVVSTALADVVDHLDTTAIQRIPVTIAPAQTDFEILNVVRSIDCLDHEQSEYSEFPAPDFETLYGPISAFITLRVLPERAIGHHIFRLGEMKLVIIVSDVLKSALEEQKFTGLKFIPV